MYNPTLANGKTRRRPVLNPHSGTKHSDIIRKSGVGSTAPVSARRDKTEHGYVSPIFNGANFSVRYEVLYAGNAVGFGVNLKADRAIRVLRGVMFVTVENSNGERALKEIPTNGVLSAPRGTKHGYATSGTSDLELEIIEDRDFAASWKAQGEDVFRATDNEFISAPTASLPPRRTRTSKAAAQAAEIVAAKRGRKPGKKAAPAQVNPNTSTRIGVSPRPHGAEAFASDE